MVWPFVYFFCLFWWGGTVDSSAAEERQHDSIVAIVNGTAVTWRELEDSITMAIISEGTENSQETRKIIRSQVLDSLILDILKEQEGERFSLSPSQDSIEKAIRTIEQQNGVKEGGFGEFMNAKGMPVDSVIRRIRADLYWDNIIRYKLTQDVFVSERDVDDELERYQSLKGKKSYTLHDLFIPHGSKTPEENHDFVSGLRRSVFTTPQIFYNFVTLVDKHSQMPSGSVGGNLGWTEIEFVPQEARYEIAQLRIGEVSTPIVTNDGVHLYYLRDKRLLSEKTSRKIKLRRFILDEKERSLTDEEYAQALNLLDDVVLRDRFCSLDDEAVIENFQVAGAPFFVESLGTLQEGDIVSGLSQVLLQVFAGEITPALRDEDATFFIQICNRDIQYVEFPSRQLIRDSLFQNRLNQLAQRYIQDLLGKAHIDIKDESIGS